MLNRCGFELAVHVLDVGKSKHLRIAVTGATGFVGAHLVPHLISCGYSVVALVRDKEPGPGRRVVDFRDTESIVKALADIDIVVHAAGLAHVRESGGETLAALFREANSDLPGRVANAAVAANVRRIVLVSSAGVLGAVSPPGGFSDESAANPYNIYTESKLGGELAVYGACATGTLEVIVIRPPMIYGPGAPGSYQRLRQWISRGWPVPVLSTAALRSYIGIRNFCDAVVAAIATEIVPTVPILVADCDALSASDFAREISLAMGKRFRSLRIPAGLLRTVLAALGRKADGRRLEGAFVLKPHLAKQTLGWEPRFSCREDLWWSEQNHRDNVQRGLAVR